MIELKTDQEILDGWKEMESCWLSPEIPKLQYKTCTERELEAYQNGAKIAPFDAMVQCLLKLPTELDTPETKLLDVGASAAYYKRVLEIAGFKYDYTACDYNSAFRDLANEIFKKVRFDIEDATKLTYFNGEFDIVISGCCMLHIKDYRAVVFETARVTKKYAIFHRQPILHNKATTYFSKLAYGIPCMEIHFNEDEFMMLLKMAGFEVIHFERIFTTKDNGGYSHISYLVQKHA